MTPGIPLPGLLALLAAWSPVAARGQDAPRAASVLRPTGVRLWIVDEDGPGHFARVQDAVEAAGPGDWILVRLEDVAPTESVVVEGKPLTFVGGGPSPALAARFVVRGLAAGEAVVVRGLELGPYVDVTSLGPQPPIVELEDDAGTVWLEDCRIVAHGGSGLGIAWSSQEGALDATDCDSVVLVRCAFAPFSYATTYQLVEARYALRATRSAVHAFSCDVRGQEGANETLGTSFALRPGSGGAAGVLVDSFLYAADCTFAGGDAAGTVCESPGGPAGDGGDGLVVDARSEAHVLGSTFEGGSAAIVPGSQAELFCVPGTAGAAVVGALDLLAGALRTYRLDPPASGAATATLTATGPPGDLVVTLASEAPASTWQPRHLGTLALAPGIVVTVEGAIPAGGTLVVGVPLPPLARLEPARTLFRQGLFFDASGAAFLAGPSVLVRLR